MTSDLQVVFIVGMPRSGSTLLDLALGSSTGVAPLGEMSNVWSHGVVERRRCSCGERFHRCGFWGTAAASDADLHDRSVAERMAATHRHILPTSRIHRLLTSSGRARLMADLPAGYLDRLGRLYQATAAAVGVSVVVDSSKHPIYGYLLSLAPGLQVSFVHLVRDPRAVAHSYTRVRAEPDASAGVMNRYRVTATALMWNAWNLAAGRFHQHGRYERVRYEDFVAHPREVLHSIISYLAVSGGSPAIDGTRLRPREYHAISGNPMRFTPGPITIKADDEWLTGMTARRKAAVTLATAGLLPRYRYPILTR